MLANKWVRIAMWVLLAWLVLFVIFVVLGTPAGPTPR
jgi:hypothetical protein